MAEQERLDRDRRQGPRCPLCGKPRDPRYRPFCSALCRDRDLLNWLDGAYAVPAVEIEDDDEDPRPRGEE
jgi:endogenous inhibitor of DNA gyrase (YacG/DUF329 family)